MENSKSNWIKTYIVDVLPVISIALYVLAYVYNISFYKVFNIDIIPFLSFSDTLQSIIRPLIMIVLLSMPLIIFFPHIILLFVDNKKHTIKENNKTANKIISVQNFSIDFSIILLVSLALFFIVIYYFDIPNGNLYAPTICVLIPLALLAIYSQIAPLNKIILKRFKTISNISRIELVAIMVFYYIYAFYVFEFSGKEMGKYIMNHNKTAFEIKLSDGTLYNDSKYTYISYLNCNYFLYERKTKDVIILPNGKLNYVKINIQKKND